ncbi:MAG: hypothetical protein ACI92G_004584 [Candidatus Pelagisphaera sp.]|jgi:hypothetical protein
MREFLKTKPADLTDGTWTFGSDDGDLFKVIKEGTGFTNMICAIAAANSARTPLLVLASNMSLRGDDTQSPIQRGYQ